MESSRTPKFSIVMPTYNRCETILPPLESVFSQTSTDYELIVVDDGSTDGTAKLIKQLQLTYANLRYIYQENSERCVARNRGIDEARGKFVCFLDSDDFYTPNHLETFNRYTEQYPEHHVFASYAKGGLQFPGKDFLSIADLLDQNPFNLGQICFRRAQFRDLRFPLELSRAQDLYFIRALFVQSSAVLVPEFTFYKNDAVVTHSARPSNAATLRRGTPDEVAGYFMRSTILFLDRYRHLLTDAQQQRMVQFSSLVCANIYATFGSKRTAVSHLKRALATPGIFGQRGLYNALAKIFLRVLGLRRLMFRLIGDGRAVRETPLN